MQQDEAFATLRHAAKYLQARFKETGDFDDFQAMNLLKWSFTRTEDSQAWAEGELSEEVAFAQPLL